MPEANSGKKYIIDGVTYRFDYDFFIKLFTLRQKHQIPPVNEGTYRAALAKAVNVSEETVKKWKQQKSAPVDIDRVGEIATFLKVDIMELLIEEKSLKETEENNMNTERETAKHLYELMAEYIEMYARECGFKEFGNQNVEVDYDEEKMEYGVQKVDFSMCGEGRIVEMRFLSCEDERKLHAVIRRELGLARFDLPEKVVNELAQLFYIMEPDPLESSYYYELMTSDEEFKQYADQPSAEFYYIEAKVRGFYKELNSILESYFA